MTDYIIIPETKGSDNYGHITPSGIQDGFGQPSFKLDPVNADYKVVSLKTWPIVEPEAPIVYKNLVTNPRFHESISGWTSVDNLAVSSSVPWGDMPAGAPQCGVFDMSGGCHITVPELASFNSYGWTFTVGATPDDEESSSSFWCDLGLYLFDAGNNEVGNYSLRAGLTAKNGWHTYSGTKWVSINNVDHGMLSLYCEFGTPTGNCYATKFCVGADFTGYYDGDSEHWSWEGDPHNSISSGTV